MPTANVRWYKAQTPLDINGVPHGERILWPDPWIYGRKVRDLQSNAGRNNDEEVITGENPKTSSGQTNPKRSIVVASEGRG